MTAFELAAALVSAWAVWLTARRRPWCWPVGLVSVLAYAWVFAGAKLYSDALTGEGGDAPTYVDMMRHNIKQISAALMS